MGGREVPKKQKKERGCVSSVCGRGYKNQKILRMTYMEAPRFIYDPTRMGIRSLEIATNVTKFHPNHAVVQYFLRQPDCGGVVSITLQLYTLLFFQLWGSGKNGREKKANEKMLKLWTLSVSELNVSQLESYQGYVFPLGASQIKRKSAT